MAESTVSRPKKSCPKRAHGAELRVSGCLFHLGLNPTKITVYLVIKLHDWGEPWDMTYGQIAEEAGVSRATAQRAVAALMRIKAVRRDGPKRGIAVWRAEQVPMCDDCLGVGR